MLKAKLVKLEAEVTHLKEILIEKESDLHAKAVQCRHLETKLKKTHNELQHVVEESKCRLNSMQQEIVRLEANNVDTTENYRRIQVSEFFASYRFNWKPLWPILGGILMFLIPLDGKAENCVEFWTPTERSTRNQKACSQRRWSNFRESIQASQSFQVSLTSS